MSNFDSTLPDWDWGSVANTKLEKLCKNKAQIDWLSDYLVQEMPTDELAWYVLRYTPITVLKQIAEDIGTYNLTEEA